VDPTPVVVSVVIPAHEGRESVVRRAVSSALAEARENLVIEPVVVDDGSPGSLIADAVQEFDVVYIRRTCPGGAGAARQSGLDSAAGTWTAFLDSDDTFVPGRISKQLAIAGDADIVGGLTRRDYDTGPGAVLPDYLATRSVDEMIDTPFGASLHPYLIRTTLAALIGFDVDVLAWEDWDFLYRLRLERPLLVTLPEIVSGMHGGSTLRVSEQLAPKADALEAMYRKHHGDITKNRGRAAAWAYFIASAHRRAGNPRSARRWTMTSLAWDPFHPRRALALARRA
jgi:glycosyltransferase involved in cell wall biosynthesis